ncbi:glycosyltransferase 87 family protein [Nakamurella antarctica]|nr:glycosyltransferase 87 family protein [Nakamurella antarctica]
MANTPSAPDKHRVRWWLVTGVLCAFVATIFTAVSVIRFLDLAVYRAAGQAVLHGIDPYGPGLLARLPFTYPPAAGWFFAPLAAVPWSVTPYLWSVITLLLLAWVVHRALLVAAPSLTGAQESLTISGIVALSSVSAPVADHLGFGQINIALMAACVYDVVGSGRRTSRRLPQGLLIGFATAIKLTPGIFIVYLLITRRYRAAGIATAGAIALTVVAAALSPHATSKFFGDVFWNLGERVGLGNNAVIGNQSLQGAMLRLLGPDTEKMLWPVLVAVAGLAGLWAARRVFQNRGDLAGSCVIGLLVVVVSPVSWTHYLVWLIPLLVLLVSSRRRGEQVVAIVITVALLARTHRLGGDFSLTANDWFSKIGAALLANSYLLICVAVIVYLAVTPRRASSTSSHTDRVL